MNTCPECNSRDIAAFGDCHTWPSKPDNTGWMSCQGCGTALHLFCCEDDCDWSYTWGLNPDNPRFPFNEVHRPSWLRGEFKETYPQGWVWPYESGVARPLDSPAWDDYNEKVREKIAMMREEASGK